jgi:DNA-nicking Smr family endonuclease
MTFGPGDRVHLAGLGTGIIVEARGARRYAVDIKGRIVVAAAGDLELASAPTQSTRKRAATPAAPAPAAPAAPVGPGRTRSHPAAPGRTRAHPAAPARTQPSLDLHGKTVDEAIEAVEVWVNDVLLAGHGEARVIHGRGGGRLKAALHQYLRGLGAVATFRVDPRNPGVTIVTFA